MLYYNFDTHTCFCYLSTGKFRTCASFHHAVPKNGSSLNGAQKYCKVETGHALQTCSINLGTRVDMETGKTESYVELCKINVKENKATRSLYRLQYYLRYYPGKTMNIALKTLAESQHITKCTL